MAIIEQNSMPFKPYARLMNIIGDQLITDKKVAVIEIIKNSYDADATNVKVNFCNMQNLGFNDLPIEEQAYIEIEDNGTGMSLDMIKNIWMRPATPVKLDKKRIKEDMRTPLGRIIQGEKGIGRFAIHKLGERINLYTKAKNNNEIKLEMNFYEFDPENMNLFNQGKNSTKYKLLDEVSNNWYVNVPPERISSESGTVIRIYNLREQWIEDDFIDLYKNIQRLLPPTDENSKKLGIEFISDFEIHLYINNKKYESEDVITFKDVIENAPFRMLGTITSKGVVNFNYESYSPERKFKKTINLFNKQELADNNYVLTGLKLFHEKNKKPDCGGFSFTFYAFDLSKAGQSKINKDIKNFIKENFIYVLRDGVRVYPYGEKGIDWLNLDKLRSTVKAGQFMSYNELTGFIYISQDGNPFLKDASNRQGIVNINGRYDEFTNLVRSITEIFNHEIKIDKAKAEIKKKKNISKSKNILENSYNKFQSSLIKINNKETLDLANKFIDIYKNHLSILEDRMQIVEDLAGLGMAVEKSSHDSLRLLSLMRQNIDLLMKKIKHDSCDKQKMLEILSELDENIELIYNDLQLIQPLFKVHRSDIDEISIQESINKVISYFRSDIEDNINICIENQIDDLKIKTNLGLILQVLINLVDNAIYWIKESEKKEGQIKFKIDTKNKSLIIADNGNGIREDITPLIFKEFFSMKSQGRGLGLYIVQELLFRINADIYVIENSKDKILPGANFIIKFNKETK